MFCLIWCSFFSLFLYSRRAPLFAIPDPGSRSERSHKRSFFWILNFKIGSRIGSSTLQLFHFSRFQKKILLHPTTSSVVQNSNCRHRQRSPCVRNDKQHSRWEFKPITDFNMSHSWQLPWPSSSFKHHSSPNADHSLAACTFKRIVH